jgi:hypothetical protein
LAVPSLLEEEEETAFVLKESFVDWIASVLLEAVVAVAAIVLIRLMSPPQEVRERERE